VALAAPELLEELRVAFPQPASWPFDFARALYALAGVETAWQLGRIGDDGTSFGLWQVHNPSVPFPRGANVREEVWWPPLHERFRAAILAIGAAAAELVRRRRAGDQVLIDAAAPFDWLGIAWQFGPGALESWTRRRDRHDFRALAWAREISPSSNVTPEQWLSRAAQFRRLYNDARG